MSHMFKMVKGKDVLMHAVKAQERMEIYLY
jgi:hypothetical protein